MTNDRRQGKAVHVPAENVYIVMALGPAVNNIDNSHRLARHVE